MAVTKESAIEIMKSRGYTHVSTIGEDKGLGFSKDMNGIYMSATVWLEKETIEMHAGVLKMMCELVVKGFDFYHKRFDEFEKWAYFYGKVCSEIDTVVENLDFIPQRVYMAESNLTLQEPAKEVVKKKTLEERKQAFKKKVIEIGKEKDHEPEMCKAFFNYWSEVSDGGNKMRWEIAKTKGGTFSIAGRLVTWRDNDKVFKARFLDRKEKEAKKQNEELKKETPKASTKELF